ncbi:MAG: hypothetical protein SFT92_05785 [Rickettsiales bacterium]|nr:hypothetical protein [Rickettsiales bacterium]
MKIDHLLQAIEKYLQRAHHINAPVHIRVKEVKEPHVQRSSTRGSGGKVVDVVRYRPTSARLFTLSTPSQEAADILAGLEAMKQMEATFQEHGSWGTTIAFSTNAQLNAFENKMIEQLKADTPHLPKEHRPIKIKEKPKKEPEIRTPRKRWEPSAEELAALEAAKMEEVKQRTLEQALEKERTRQANDTISKRVGKERIVRKARHQQWQQEVLERRVLKALGNDDIDMTPD